MARLRRPLAYALLLTGAALAVLGAVDSEAVLPLVGQPEVAGMALVLTGIVLRGRRPPRAADQG